MTDAPMQAPVQAPADGGIALVLAGGAALGAFEAGAYAALDEAGEASRLRWVAGSSIGAVTAAILAGNAPGERLPRLRRFWDTVSHDPAPLLSFWFGRAWDGPWREAVNQLGVLQTLVFGAPGLFRPRLQPGPRAGADDVPALHDLAPLERHLEDLVDFDRLNSGAVRVSLAATDVVSGERVVFDTGRGCTLQPRHILASCALMPLLAPVEVEGRLLGDGGFASNTPLDLVLCDPAAPGLHCFVVDLFDPKGSRPHTLAAGASRAGDLVFGNQSRRLMEGHEREARLRSLIHELGALLPGDVRHRAEIAAILAEGRPGPARVEHIGYRAGLDEAGMGKTLDFTAATVADRWAAGHAQMQAALRQPAARMAASVREPTATTVGLPLTM